MVLSAVDLLSSLAARAHTAFYGKAIKKDIRRAHAWPNWIHGRAINGKKATDNNNTRRLDIKVSFLSWRRFIEASPNMGFAPCYAVCT